MGDEDESIDVLFDELLTLTCCNICYCPYDGDIHLPLACANYHFVCQKCINDQVEKTKNTLTDVTLKRNCPFCRTPYSTSVTKKTRVGGRDLLKISDLIHKIKNKYENESANKRRKKNDDTDFSSSAHDLSINGASSSSAFTTNQNHAMPTAVPRTKNPYYESFLQSNKFPTIISGITGKKIPDHEFYDLLSTSAKKPCDLSFFSTRLLYITRKMYLEQKNHFCPSPERLPPRPASR